MDGDRGVRKKLWEPLFVSVAIFHETSQLPSQPPCEVGTGNEQQFERQPLQYLVRYFSSSMVVSFFPLICPIINPRDSLRENSHGTGE